MEPTNNIFLDADPDFNEENVPFNDKRRLLTAVFGAFVVASSINSSPINIQTVNPNIKSSSVKIENRGTHDTLNYQLDGGSIMSENNGFLNGRDYESLNKLIDKQNQHLEQQIAMTKEIIDTQEKNQKENMERIETTIKELNKKIDGLPSQEETVNKIRDEIRADHRQWKTWAIAIGAIVIPSVVQVVLHFLN
ncbi:hypothetical protein RA086_05540 [Lactiplantibacillus sp. WILCCON 0030]|uniref:Uncharacterized protein n=1 Tax=Lactiplantibacillus brownii TaxID=3069269 RepID=A0ABU1A834_9LACO|nr:MULTISPECIES: hypothetical protein [Lactiplantibacillus]MDQ7937089.1 hypothetical protein [Lactiplantibacillus brownii]